jgi:predicted enzyme related to lactoylglutathione lyase
VIRHTPNHEELTRFYRDELELEVARQAPGWVEFETGETSLALLETSGEPGHELCFEVDDVEAAAQEARGRGMKFLDEIKDEAFGRVVHVRDGEGVVVTLLQPAWKSARRGAATLATVILNTWDFGDGTRFYRDRLGLDSIAETPHWIEFDSGGARIALHARAERPDLPAHAGQKLACAFEVEDVEAWAEAHEERGGTLATEPTEEPFGTYAEVMDPDGILVVFRQPPSVLPVPAVAAEAFEDDEKPNQASMRRPLSKKAKAVSRVALRTERTGGKKATRARYGKKAAKAPARARGTKGGLKSGVESKSKKLRVKTTRGAGPGRTRLEPKTLRDLKRAKAKPARGRQAKAERRSASSKKTALAASSRRHPVKRAAAKRGRR